MNDLLPIISYHLLSSPIASPLMTYVLSLMPYMPLFCKSESEIQQQQVFVSYRPPPNAPPPVTCHLFIVCLLTCSPLPLNYYIQATRLIHTRPLNTSFPFPLILSVWLAVQQPAPAQPPYYPIDLIDHIDHIDPIAPYERSKGDWGDCGDSLINCGGHTPYTPYTTYT